MPFKKGEGGRPKGAKNLRSFNAEEIANRLDIDPLEVLLLFAKGDWKSLGYHDEKIVTVTKDGAKEEFTIQPAVRARSAAEACKYFYSQKQAVALSTNEEGFKIVIEDYTKEKK